MHILLNPLHPSSRISYNSKFCNGLVSFEITRFNCKYIFKKAIKIKFTLTFLDISNTALLCNQTLVSMNNDPKKLFNGYKGVERAIDEEKEETFIKRNTI